MAIKDDEKRKAIYEDANRQVSKDAINLQKSKERASSSAINIPVEINDDKFYFINLSDLHIPEGDVYALVDTLKEFAKIPNLYLGFGGDQINNSIKSSIGDTHSEVLSGEEQVKMLAGIIKDINEEVNIIDKIAYIQAGNHENRSEKNTSLNPAYLLASELDIQHRYAKNIARVTFEMNHSSKKDEKVKYTVIASHGEKNPSKSGAQIEHGLASKIDQGADCIIGNHNHKAGIASTIKREYLPNRVTPEYRQVTFANFGSMIAGGDYADQANYPYPRATDGEILRITNVEGNKKADFVNYKGLVNSIAKSYINDASKEFKLLEARDYKTSTQIKRAYSTKAKNLLSYVKKGYNKEMEIYDFSKKSNATDKIFFAPLNGFKIGDEELKNDKEVKQKVDVLSKLNGSCRVVLNGDMIHYKKAITIGQGKKGEKFVEDTYSYMQDLAETLKPIADKIVAINYGMQENNIMKYQADELAKYAMQTNQMDEKLVFMPYNKAELLREQRKIQRRHVSKYNKDMLENETGKFYKGNENLETKFFKLLSDSLDNFDDMNKDKQTELVYKTVTEFNNIKADENHKPKKDSKDKEEKEKGNAPKSKKEKQRDFVKEYVSKKLRKDGKLLSVTKDKEYINHLFPLEEIKDKTPHENLVAHMLCDFLGINPKSININNNVNENSHFETKIKDDTNKTRNISFVGSASKSLAKRNAVQNHLKNKQNLIPGANVYYTNTRLGKEFTMLDSSVLSDSNGDNYKQDTYYISGGTFAGFKEREYADNKLYKFFATANEEKPAESRGIYENARKDFNLYCESLNYETALLEDDVLTSIIKNQTKESYFKSISKLENKKTKDKIKKFINKFDDEVLNAEEETEEMSAN